MGSMHLFIYNVCTVTPVLKTETCKYLNIFHKIHTVKLKSIQTDKFSNYIKCFCNHGNMQFKRSYFYHFYKISTFVF